MVTSVTEWISTCQARPLAGSSVGIATGCAGRSGNRIPVGATFSAPVQTGPGAHPASCTVRTEYFPGLKGGRGLMLTPHPLLVLWSRKSRAIPLLPLWAVRPVQSLNACTRVHFTFYQARPATIASVKKNSSSFGWIHLPLIRWLGHIERM